MIFVLTVQDAVFLDPMVPSTGASSTAASYALRILEQFPCFRW
jgi:hypothetical protein